MDTFHAERDFFCALRYLLRELLGLKPDGAPLDDAVYQKLVGPLRSQVGAYTRDRKDSAQSQLSTEREVAANLAYYGVRSFLTARVLATAYDLDGSSILDLGAGSGAFGLALHSGAKTQSWTLVEPSSQALAAARRMAQRLGITPPATLVGDVEQLAWKNQRASTVVVANTINEWPGSLEQHLAILHSAMQCVLPGGNLVIVEPAQRRTARHMSRLHDGLLELGFHVAGPCSHQQQCPMLQRRRDFCHGRRRLLVPEDFVLLGKKAANLDLADSDFATLIVRQGEVPSSSAWRVVGDLRREKGRDRIFLCGDSGLLELFTLTGSGRPAPEALRPLHRGHVVQLDRPVTEARLRIEDPAMLKIVGELP